MRSIDELYQECLNMGVVTNQRAFSALWGKRPSWFSSSQARNRVPTVGAMVAFYVRLERISIATREELGETRDSEETEALIGGLEEIEKIRNELWLEIRKRSESNVAY